MRTLKQIRETYDRNNPVQIPDELMLEGIYKGFSETDPKRPKDISKVSPIPSAKEMPVMLVFRRVQFRVFPNRQVVALYYSNMVDKYLSIPFGPGGNLNLSESRILNNLQELTDEEERDIAGVKKNYGWKEYVPGYVDQKKASGNFKKKNYGQALKFGIRSLGKKALTAAGLGLSGLYAAGAVGAAGGAAGVAKNVATGAAGNAIGSAAVNAVKKASEKTKDILAPAKGPTLGNSKSPVTKSPSKSSWNTLKSQNSVYLSKMRQANLIQAKNVIKNARKNVAENSIKDLRKMVKEGVEYKDLDINGRTIKLNTSMAKRILETYDSLNTKNKKIVEGMMNSSIDDFKKLLQFSVR